MRKNGQHVSSIFFSVDNVIHTLNEWVFYGNYSRLLRPRHDISNEPVTSRLYPRCHFFGPKHLHELLLQVPPSNEHRLYISNEGLESAHATQIICKQLAKFAIVEPNPGLHLNELKMHLKICNDKLFRALEHERSVYNKIFDGCRSKRFQYSHCIENRFACGKTKNIASYNYYQGIPKLIHVLDSITSISFKKMEVYNNLWLGKNHSAPYEHKNVSVLDSLHSWSRIWEYPFIFSILKSFENRSIDILDYGSKYSFFPWFLQQNKLWKVTAFAANRNFDVAYNKISSSEKEKVRWVYQKEKLQKYDCIYSISVLQYMDDPISYIQEVYGMLKADGYFAVTMEVDTSNIDNTKRLVAYMQSIFHEPFGIAKVNLDNDSLTLPLISNMYPFWQTSNRKGANATVFCAVYQKTSSQSLELLLKF